MSNVITTFIFNESSVRTVTKDSEVWFVASDIAKALNYRDAANMVRVLDDDEVGTHIVSTPSGDQEMAIIGESGMYHAILKSRKPEAKPFRKWVTSEVLPAIRKTGKYEATITPEQQSDLQAIVATISPDGRRRGEVWARFNRHFKIAKYSQLPSGKIEEARSYLIETFLDGQYIEDNPYPLVDIKKVLTGGMDDPIVPFSDELQRAINAKSFEVAHEFLETFQKHLSRRIAYTCEVGFPNRVINEQKALDVVRDTSIDTALTHHFYGLLTNVKMMADSIKAMTGTYSNDIANALGKKQLMIA